MEEELIDPILSEKLSCRKFQKLSQVTLLTSQVCTYSLRDYSALFSLPLFKGFPVRKKNTSLRCPTMTDLTLTP